MAHRSGLVREPPVRNYFDPTNPSLADMVSSLNRTTLLLEPGAKTKTGLDSPAMTVFVKFEDGKKEERVTFGKVENDAYAARPGEPGAAKIDASDFNEAVKALDEISK